VNDLDFDAVDAVEFAPGRRVVFRRKGQGPPIVLLHGGVGSWNHWVRNIGPLSRRFTVFAPDMPGFGDSDDAEPRAPYDVYHGYVAAAVERMLPPGKPFHLVGFSFGGMIGSGVACRLNHRLAAATFIAPSGFFPTRTRKVKLRKRQPDLTAAQVRELHRYNLNQFMLHRPQSIGEDTITSHEHNHLRSRFNNFHLSRSGRVFGTMPLIVAPLQLIWGEQDRTVNPEVADRVDVCRTWMPPFELHTIPDAGHWAAYEAAETVNRLLTAFHGQFG